MALSAIIALDRIDLLLADVQGAETATLLGCAPVRSQHDGSGSWSFRPTTTSISGDPLTHQRCLRILRDAGCASRG